MARGAPNMSKNYPHMQRGSTAQGELEGTKPASNPIECPAKPCCARRTAHDAEGAGHMAGAFSIWIQPKTSSNRNSLRQ